MKMLFSFLQSDLVVAECYVYRYLIKFSLGCFSQKGLFKSTNKDIFFCIVGVCEKEAIVQQYASVKNIKFEMHMYEYVGDSGIRRK